MRSGLSRTDIQGRIKELVEALFINIPSGLGSHRKDLKLSREEERRGLKKGARWAVEKGFGSAEDLDHIEEHGCIEGGDPDRVSEKAMERGRLISVFAARSIGTKVPLCSVMPMVPKNGRSARKALVST